MYFLFVTFVVLLLILFFLIINFLNESKVAKNHKNIVKSSSKRNTTLLIQFIVLLFLLGVTVYHLFTFGKNLSMWYYPVIIYSFLWNILSLVASLRYKPYVINKDREELEQAKLNNFETVVVVPVYNEDKESFHKLLDSLLVQTILPKTVYIVEDGSKEEYKVEELVSEWRKKASFKVVYKYVENAGKRQAQSHAFYECQDTADIFITLDSDTVLDKRAVEETLIAFLDEKVTAVAGLLLSLNRNNFLSKLLGISFPSAFTNGRAWASKFNAVAVSCGGLASYRVNVIKEYLEEYLNQQVFGQKAVFGDDRMLTHYASVLGKTVYQETSIGYTLMPENISHLTRQRVRWWKSFWWGGMFIVRHHQPKYMIWWIVVGQYISQILYAVVFPFILFINPILNGRFPWAILIYMVVLGCIRSIRLLSIKDSEGTKYVSILQYIVYAPMSVLLNIYLCTILSYYAFFTVWQVSSWGTREKLEVKLQAKNELSDSTN